MAKRKSFRKAASSAARAISRPSPPRRARRRTRRQLTVSNVVVSRSRPAVSRRVRSVRRRGGRVKSGGMKFMGSSINDLIALTGGILAGWKAPRFTIYQDPAVFMGAGVLGSGILGSSQSVNVLKNVSIGYLLGSVGSSLIGSKLTVPSDGKGPTTLRSDNNPNVVWMAPTSST